MPYADRKPLYAAYRAAHAEVERLGGQLSDDLIIQAAVRAYEAELLAQGWRPAGPDETPGQVEPDDDQPQPQDLTTEVHKPCTDEGVTYCGWDGHDGCGNVWPCPTVRARSTVADVLAEAAS